MTQQQRVDHLQHADAKALAYQDTAVRQLHMQAALDTIEHVLPCLVSMPSTNEMRMPDDVDSDHYDRCVTTRLVVDSALSKLRRLVLSGITFSVVLADPASVAGCILRQTIDDVLRVTIELPTKAEARTMLRMLWPKLGWNSWNHGESVLLRRFHTATSFRKMACSMQMMGGRHRTIVASGKRACGSRPRVGPKRIGPGSTRAPEGC